MATSTTITNRETRCEHSASDERRCIEPEEAQQGMEKRQRGDDGDDAPVIGLFETLPL